MWYTEFVRGMSSVHLSIISHQTVYHHCYEYYHYCGRSRCVVVGLVFHLERSCVYPALCLRETLSRATPYRRELCPEFIRI